MKKTTYPDCHICPLGECAEYYGYLCKNRDCRLNDNHKKRKADKIHMRERRSYENLLKDKGFYSWLSKHPRIKRRWQKLMITWHSTVHNLGYALNPKFRRIGKGNYINRKYYRSLKDE